MKYTELEERLERREKIALNLAEQLSKKIDECEELKSEVERLNNLINTIPLADHVDTTGGEWAWEQ